MRSPVLSNSRRQRADLAHSSGYASALRFGFAVTIHGRQQDGNLLQQADFVSCQTKLGRRRVGSHPRPEHPQCPGSRRHAQPAVPEQLEARLGVAFRCRQSFPQEIDLPPAISVIVK